MHSLRGPLVLPPVPDGVGCLLTLRLFGPFAVHVNGQPLPRLRSRHGQALLALLTLRHDREVERPWLAGVLTRVTIVEFAARGWEARTLLASGRGQERSSSSAA